MKTDDTRYVYQNKLDEPCFQHNMADGDYKDLTKRTGCGKVLRGKAFSIASYLKHDECQRGLTSMVYKFFDKKSDGSATFTPITLESQRLINELNKLIIRKFNKRCGYSYFRDNIWSADLADEQLISKYNKGVKGERNRFFFIQQNSLYEYKCCILRMFSYLKRSVTLSNTFQAALKIDPSSVFKNSYI